MANYTCSCGARYKFPDSALGKSAKCKKCGAVFTLEVEEDDGGVFALAEDPDFPSRSHLENPVASESASQQPQQGEVFTASGFPSSANSKLDDSQTGGVNISDHTFATNVFRTILFPTDLENSISFSFICIGMVLGTFAGFVGRLGFLITIVVYGWYSAYRFMVLSSIAGGDEKIPGINDSLGSWSEYVSYFLKWSGCWLLVMLPVFIFVTFNLVQSGMSPFSVFLSILNEIVLMSGYIGGTINVSFSDMGIIDVLLLLGMLIWPMFILCIGLGGFSVFNQPDLIFVAVLKTFHVYFVAVLIILGLVVGRAIILNFAGGQSILESQRTVSGVMSTSISMGISFVILSVYIDIVIMRVIGLYYFHCKKKFAWSWE